MSLPSLAIRNPVFTWMLMIGLILFGGLFFTRLGVSLYPDVDFPTLSVRAQYEGANPAVMEKDVVEPIESGLVSVEGVQYIESSIKTGSAQVSVSFDLSKDINVAVQEVQSALGRVQRLLPDGVESPSISKSNPEDRPVMWLSVTSTSLTRRDLMRVVREQVQDQFSTVPGVGELSLGGFIDPNIRVDIESKKLQAYELSVGDIVQALKLQHSELPAGQLDEGDTERSIRVMGELGSAEEFSRLIIPQRGGRPSYANVRLGQVANVYEGLDNVRRISRVNLEPSIGLGVRKQRGANTVDVAESVKQRMENLRAQLPEGVFIQVNFDSSEYVREAVNELLFVLLLSSLLTAVVCWLFLNSWFAVLNTLLAIPTSVLGSFIFLYAFGFTLNTFTLLGLALSIGIVVDDAIIMIENITRYREKGLSRMEAAFKGSREITFAVIATTAALVAIFLPVAFMEGVVGKFFFQFGVTIAVAVILSSIEALTLAPMRCSQFLDVGQRKTRVGLLVDGFLSKLTPFYEKTLLVALQNKWKVLGFSTLFFLGSLSFLFLLKKEFVPNQDQGSLFISFRTPDGSSIDYTDTKMFPIEQFLMKQPYIERYFTAIGGFGGGGQANTAFMFITLKDQRDRELSQQEVVVQLRNDLKQFEGIRGFIQGNSSSVLSGGQSYPIDFTIQGPDREKLKPIAEKMIQELSDSGQAVDVNSKDLVNLPEVRVIPDRQKATARGVSVQAISETMNALYGGVVPVKYSEGGRRSDVKVQIIDQEKRSMDDLKNVFLRNNRGELVSLSSVVTLEEGIGPQEIYRLDRYPGIRIEGNLAENVSQGEALKLVEKKSAEIVPFPNFVKLGGGSEEFQKSFRSLIIAMVLGVLVAYMVLASQFNSFIDPLAILMALPFSFAGAFISLYIGGQTLNVYSFIGLILLMGISKKNGILLIEFTKQLRFQGRETKDALMEACPIRLRPVLMTSFATLAAAIPPALSFGPGAETRIPLSLAIVGGVFVSTALTLYVVPCFYLLITRKTLSAPQLQEKH